MTCTICNSVFRQFGCHVCGSMPNFDKSTGMRDGMVNRRDFETRHLAKEYRRPLQVVRAHGAICQTIAHGSRSEQLASYRRIASRIEDRLIFAIDSSHTSLRKRLLLMS